MKTVIIILLACTLFASCRTTKLITRTEYKSDSTYERKYDSVVKEKQQLNEAWERTVKEGMDQGIFFGDPVQTPAGYGINNTAPKDSIKTIAGQNQVEIKPDGTVIASGNIKAFKTKQAAESTEKKIGVYQSDKTTEVKKESSGTTTIEAKSKEKEIKRSSFPWWLLIVAFAGGCAFWQYKSKILSPIKTVFMKGKFWLLALVFLPLLLTSCYDFTNSPGVSVWSGGVGVFAWIFIIGFLVLLIMAFQQAEKDTKTNKYPGKKVRFYQTKFFAFACFVFAIGAWWIIAHISDR